METFECPHCGYTIIIIDNYKVQAGVCPSCDAEYYVRLPNEEICSSEYFQAIREENE